MASPLRGAEVRPNLGTDGKAPHAHQSRWASVTGSSITSSPLCKVTSEKLVEAQVVRRLELPLALVGFQRQTLKLRLRRGAELKPPEVLPVLLGHRTRELMKALAARPHLRQHSG